jgi:hypothetical protein
MSMHYVYMQLQNSRTSVCVGVSKCTFVLVLQALQLAYTEHVLFARKNRVTYSCEYTTAE